LVGTYFGGRMVLAFVRHWFKFKPIQISLDLFLGLVSGWEAARRDRVVVTTLTSFMMAGV
jgi:hypothetical protein